MGDSKAQKSPTPSSLREQIRIACQKTRMIPSGVPQEEYARLKNLYVDEAMQAVTTYIEDIKLAGIADRAVVDNIKLVVDSQLPAEWTNPVTGKKLYNQAYIEAAEIEARVDELKLIQLLRETEASVSAALSLRINELQHRTPDNMHRTTISKITGMPSLTYTVTPEQLKRREVDAKITQLEALLADGVWDTDLKAVKYHIKERILPELQAQKAVLEEKQWKTQ